MTRTVLSVRGLSAAFADASGELRALDHVSFDLRAREFLCVLGPSGSGKTTLLRVVAGLLPPTGGQVTFAGEKSPRLGMVFQQANLMPWRSAIGNIRLPLEVNARDGTYAADRQAAQRRAQDMVELVGLQGFENAWPRDLSGGMAQRVALARSLVHDPDLLLLDEPFGSLDALTRERMWTELSRIWQRRKKTVIMVTHSISEALFLADRVLVLTQRPGRVGMELRVDLPRPRRDEMRFTARFGRLARKLKEAIG